MTLPASVSRAIGRVVAASDAVTVSPVAAMMATFGRAGPAPRPGDPLPPLWHGMFCTTKLPPERMGEDGLPRDEALLPAIEGFPAKLFAGARFSFRAPIRIGDEITRESEVTGFEPKEGRSGRMIFARVEHRVIQVEARRVRRGGEVECRRHIADCAVAPGGLVGHRHTEPLADELQL